MRAARALGVALLGAFVAASGCSALVSSELESVACSQDGAIGPPACPVGQSCRGGQCTPCAPKDLCGDGVDNDCNNLVDDGCDDGGLGGSAGTGGASGSGGSGGIGASGGTAGAPSGGTGGAAGTGGSGGGGTGGTGPSIGTPCSDSSSCPSGTFCGDPAWFGASGVKVCTTGCCTSDKCGEGNVCFPAVDGGSVCLPAASAGRGALGAKLVGEQCGADAECRSGLCDGRCVDTCCADADCAGSDYCTKRPLKGASRPAMLCGGPPGSGAFQAYCDSDSNCLSGICGGTSSCSKPCCTKKDCSGLLDWECVYSGGVKSCGTLGVSGSAELGQPCSGGWQCKSAQCINLGAGGFCSDSCCSDKDCVGGAGMVCRPVERTSGETELLCIK